MSRASLNQVYNLLIRNADYNFNDYNVFVHIYVLLYILYKGYVQLL